MCELWLYVPIMLCFNELLVWYVRFSTLGIGKLKTRSQIPDLQSIKNRCEHQVSPFLCSTTWVKLFIWFGSLDFYIVDLLTVYNLQIREKDAEDVGRVGSGSAGSRYERWTNCEQMWPESSAGRGFWSKYARKHDSRQTCKYDRKRDSRHTYKYDRKPDSKWA